MHKLRKSQDPPLTLMALALKAGVSYTTVWNLENGDEAKVDPEIKRRVAKVLGAQSEILFKSEVARIKRDEALLYRIQRGLEEDYKKGIITEAQFSLTRHHLLLTLFDFCPGLKFEYELEVEDILTKMTSDELGDLFHSGLTKEEAIDHLNRAALRLGLKAPELRRY